MFSKISNMLGKAWDFGSNIIKPFKNHISNGWESLKNGASKVGQFVANNHEAIGSVLSGVGNIIGNLPNSPLKQKLTNFGNNASYAGDMFSNGITPRPQNTQRQGFNNNLNSRFNQQSQQPVIRQQPEIRQQPVIRQQISPQSGGPLRPKISPARPIL